MVKNNNSSINDKTDEDSTYKDFITDNSENTISQTNSTSVQNQVLLI